MQKDRPDEPKEKRRQYFFYGAGLEKIKKQPEKKGLRKQCLRKKTSFTHPIIGINLPSFELIYLKYSFDSIRVQRGNVNKNCVNELDLCFILWYLELILFL
jgi:hypothetical protein